VEQGDAAVAFSLARFRDHPAVQRAAKVGEVSDQEPLYAITGITFAIGLLSGDRRLAEAGGRMLGAVVLSAVLKSLVKKTVTRTRPNAVMEGGRYRAALHGDARKQRQSFPSGHAAGARAGARALSSRRPRRRGRRPGVRGRGGRRRPGRARPGAARKHGGLTARFATAFRRR
jgi:membrane-associated phospholipid phosphatase